jgi:hypothetical protein
MDNEPQSPTEALEAVYYSLFPTPDGKPIELPTREGKSYALTHANFMEKKAAVVKAVASIANRTDGFGYVVFRGAQDEAPVVDGAVVDDAIRAAVFPHVAFSVDRRVIDGLTIDFLIIGPNRNRPHVMRNSAGEFVVPFRGAANNIVAGRFELDNMYETRQITSLRRELQRLSSDNDDAVGDFLVEADWGGLLETTDPEFVYAIVPQETGNSALQKFVQSADLNMNFIKVMQRTMQEFGENNWFNWTGGFASDFYDHYAELYQRARDDHRIGTIRVYDNGAVIVRKWILETWSLPDMSVFSFEHFKDALAHAVRFCSDLYANYAYPPGNVELRCAVVNAQDLNLWMTGVMQHILPNRDVGRRLYIPKRPIVLDPHELRVRAAELSETVGRALKSHYGK